MKRKTKVTMNDIARTAGVSQATVSLVLNQSRNIKLSDDTRQRVISVATELGYDRLPAIHAPRNQEEIALLVSSCKALIRLSTPSARRGKPRGATKRC
jgi:LacI family transcriptional regulator